MSTRQSDSYRASNFRESLERQGLKSGGLQPGFTREDFEAYCDHLRTLGKLQGEVAYFIGDDLSEQALDDFWRIFAGDTEPYSDMAYWWDDKPHQIAYRLVLRLTRAELENAKLRARLEEYENG